jgi:hypothetical protein
MHFTLKHRAAVQAFIEVGRLTCTNDRSLCCRGVGAIDRIPAKADGMGIPTEYASSKVSLILVPFGSGANHFV